eukprot:g11016.t1
MAHFAADYCNLHIKIVNFEAGDRLPVSVSVLQSTGWQTPPKEVCSVDGNLTAPSTTVLFESLPIGVPLFLSLKGAVKLADGRTDTLISGLEGYLGGSATLNVEAIRHDARERHQHYPHPQRGEKSNQSKRERDHGWDDGARRIQRQYSIDNHQSRQHSRPTGSGGYANLSSTISRLEKQVQDAERVQRVLQTELKKVVDDMNRMKTSSFFNEREHALEHLRLQQRVTNLTKSTIFTNFGNKSSAQKSQNTTDKKDNASPNQRIVDNLRGSNTQTSGVTKKDIQEPETIDRKLSVLSRQRIMKLDDLNTRFDVCQSEFNGLMETLKRTSRRSDKMKIKDALSQLYGNLEKLQYVEIDSVVVGDLQSGQKEAKEARKRLTKQVETLLTSVKSAVKQLQS